MTLKASPITPGVHPTSRTINPAIIIDFDAIFGLFAPATLCPKSAAAKFPNAKTKYNVQNVDPPLENILLTSHHSGLNILPLLVNMITKVTPRIPNTEIIPFKISAYAKDHDPPIIVYTSVKIAKIKAPAQNGMLKIACTI